jgi:hypothetical protein
MSGQEILELVGGNKTLTAIVIAIALGLIQISPIKLEPWTLIVNLFSKILNLVGKSLLVSITDEMKKLDTKMDTRDKSMSEEITSIKDIIRSLKDDIEHLKNDNKALRDEAATRDAMQRRTRFVRFADEIRCGQNHSSDHYHAILIDITEYELYCSSHPFFKNEIASESIRLIRDTYHHNNINQTFLEFQVHPNADKKSNN